MKRIQLKTGLLALVAIVMLSSCSTSVNRFRIKQTDQLPIVKGNIQQVSKVANYRVDPQKIEGSYNGSYDRKMGNRSIQLAKELAVGDAVTKGKCDFLIGPMYDVNVNGKTITVSVSGYPAHYTDFKTQTIADDTAQLVINKQVIVPTSNQETSQDKSKSKLHPNWRKRLKIVGLSYLGATLVALGILAASGG